MPLSQQQKDALVSAIGRVTDSINNMATQFTGAKSAIDAATASAVAIASALQSDVALVPPSITKLTATPNAVTAGDAVVIDATVANANALTLNGNVIAGLPQTVTPTANTTYTLIASGPGGLPATASVDVHVTPRVVVVGFGTVDKVSASGLVEGWSTRPITVTLDGVALPLVTPSLPRPDVVAAFPQASATTGWQVQLIPTMVDVTKPHVLRAITDDGVELWRSPWNIQAFAPPATNAGFLRLYDGPSGVDALRYNAGANLWWRNKGGDTRGAAYGRLQTTAGSTGTIDATQFVRDLIAQGNRGGLLKRVGGDGDFALPVLRVDGVVRTLIAANELNEGSESTIARTGPVLSGGYNIAFQHDIDGLTSVAAASFELTQTGHSASSFDLFMLDPPAVRTDFPMVLGGIAANYQSLEAMRADPDIDFIATPQPDMSAWCSSEGHWNDDTQFFTHPVAGPMARVTFKPGAYEPAMQLSNLLTTVRDKGNVGFWMMFDDQGTARTGSKVGVSLDFRGGQMINGRLQPTCGNGGNSTTGLTESDGSTCGGSARLVVQPAQWDRSNPAANYRTIAQYTYWSRMPVDQSAYGQMFMLGGVLLRINVPFWFEQRVDMNTVTNPDANGNGTGVADGHFAWFINGNPVDVLDYTTALPIAGMRIRESTRVGIQRVFLDFYEGGDNNVTDITKMSIGTFIFGKQYIGPPVFGTKASTGGNGGTGGNGSGGGGITPTGNTANPAWRAGKPRLSWVAIPGSVFGNFGPWTYSGAAFRRAQSELVVCGGGGTTYSGNDASAFAAEADAPSWRNVVPNAPANMIVPVGAQDIGSRNLDGSPKSCHTYYQLHHHAALDALVWVGKRNCWPRDTGNFPDVDQTTYGHAWPTATVATLAQLAAWDGAWVVQDFATGLIYRGCAWQIEVYDPATRTQRTFWMGPDGTNTVDRGAAAIGGGVLRVIGMSNGDKSTVVRDFNIATGALVNTGRLSGPAAGTLTALDSNGNNQFERGGSLDYDEGRSSFVAFIDDGRLYDIDANAVATDLGVTGAGPTPGHASGAHGCGVMSRMRYAPRLGGVLIAQAADVPVYFVGTV